MTLTRVALAAARAACPLVLATLAAACGTARPEAAPAADSCREGGAALTAASDAAALAGTYRLGLMASSGPREGASADGRLVLRPLDDSSAAPVLVLGLPDPSLRHPLAGTLQVDRASVGAAETGDLASLDPAAPGVLAIERRPANPEAAVELTIRLGAEANRQGRTRFDGGYFALVVRRLGTTGFAGTWTSGGTGGDSAAAGTFCARREAP